ncbi:MAG: hypothetical protein H6862_05205 [Rhodospirillales bacterium]|nr:hypothetical protein [Rhodospirillales bacterium]
MKNKLLWLFWLDTAGLQTKGKKRGIFCISFGFLILFLGGALYLDIKTDKISPLVSKLQSENADMQKHLLSLELSTGISGDKMESKEFFKWTINNNNLIINAVNIAGDSLLFTIAYLSYFSFYLGIFLIRVQKIMDTISKTPQGLCRDHADHASPDV